MRRGLYSIMLVKAARKDFPRQLLGEGPLQHGEWKAYTADKYGVKLQACRFRDLKVKDFISTCSSAIPGLPRKTKHHGNVVRPKVAEEYLKYAVAVDIHNHYRNGSVGIEDIWQTKNLQKSQLAGLLGFCFTNAHLAMKYFGKNNQPHYQFKIAASTALTQFESTRLYQTRQLNVSSEQPLHYTEKLPYSKDCFYCQHGYDKPRVQENTTTFKCVTCNISICKPTKGTCWDLHIVKGLPKKRYHKKK